MATVGYARVSSIGQSLDVQLEALAGCDKIFSEKKSGVDRSRPQFKACMEYLREGDTLKVTKFDRLARSAAHLLSIIQTLSEKNVSLVVIDQNLDTSTSTGRAMVGMMAVFAEFELDIRAERQADGIKSAKQRGVQFGRKPKLDPARHDDLRADRQSGMLIKDIMDKYSISKARVYQILSA